MTDMHFTYGAANYNERVAQRLYEQHPSRHIPHHSTFESIHRYLRVNGFFRRLDGQGRRSDDNSAI